MKSGVYEIFNVINSRQYVGSAANVHARFQDHRSELARGAHPNTHLQRAWDKYGHDSFIFSLIEPAPVRILIEREQFWMDAYGVVADGYNQAHFADAPMRGRKHSPETREKMSKARMGHPTSDATKEKLRAAMLGKPGTRLGAKNSAEHNRKISEATTGKLPSAKTREKMSAAKKGATLPPDHKEEISAGLRAYAKERSKCR